MKGKKALIARVCAATGLLAALRLLPARPQLLVLEYHRVGDPQRTPFDEGVFSCSAEAFAAQMEWLKRHWHVLTLMELLEQAAHGFVFKEPCVLITFDDGYRDNYENAFPVLRRLGLSALFFVPTQNLTAPQLMWWDKIAYIIKTTAQTRLRVGYPQQFEVDLADRRAAIHSVLQFFKLSRGIDTNRFLEELERLSEVRANWSALSPQTWMNTEELSKMMKSGMAIGSHTHSHEILGRLDAGQQEHELRFSREILQQKLGGEIEAIAYPVGRPSCFSNLTKTLARAAGYKLGFSSYGGTNPSGCVDAFDVRRMGVQMVTEMSSFKLQMLAPVHLGIKV